LHEGRTELRVAATTLSPIVFFAEMLPSAFETLKEFVVHNTTSNSKYKLRVELADM
jgi:hypothetical protein